MITLRRIRIALFASISSLVLVACGPVFTRQNFAQLSPADVYDVAPQLDPRLDERVSGGELAVLLRGKTLVTRSLNNPRELQYGYFGADGSLVISPRSGSTVFGRWDIVSGGLCYSLESGDFCSNVHAATIVENGQPGQVLYFARQNTGQPTVIFSDILPGFQFPSGRSGAAG